MPPLHPNREQGFTLLELCLVVTVVVVVLSISVPQALGARLAANENAAIATLRSIAAAQAVLLDSTQVDSNGDGKGEYGYLAEMVGVVATRSDDDGDGLSDGPGGRWVAPSPVPGLRSLLNGKGQLVQSGYVFQLILPGAGLQFMRESVDDIGNAALAGVDAHAATAYWCCYAWPTDHGTTGRRAFFVNQGGEVLACRNDDTRYEGLGRPPAGSAALYPVPGVPNMGDRPAAGVRGMDGNLWLTVR